jgi:hypothetical protein
MRIDDLGVAQDAEFDFGHRPANDGRLWFRARIRRAPPSAGRSPAGRR